MRKSFAKTFQYVLLIGVVLAGSVCLGDNVEDNKILSADDSGMDYIPLLRTFGALAIVIVLIFAARFMLKKYKGDKTFNNNDEIQIVSRKSLTFKHQLIVVKTAGKLLLLGVSPEGISKISELPQKGDEE